MKRRDFLKLSSLASLGALPACGYLKIDPMHVLLRSDLIESMEQERAIMGRARLGWTADRRIRVLFVRGTPYERGYQHGKLLRTEVQANLGSLYKKAVDKFRLEELFDEAYERQRPYIPQEYVEEMHGLAHGSKLPLHVIHGIHALPEIGEWGGKKRFKTIIKQMMDGELATSCSNLTCFKGASKDQRMYVVRILDWGLHRISRLHEFPLITVGVPEKGIPYANIGWVGFLGAISGMNAKGITLGEMGYGDVPGETMRGKPMPFLLRDVLEYASNLKDVRRIIRESPGTNSFIFMMSDGKSKESELYIRDHDRFVVKETPGKDYVDRENHVKGVEHTLYGGHYLDKMEAVLKRYHGGITPELLMDKIIPEIVMPSNFQNVVYAPEDLKFWVANAKSKEEAAAQQPYTFFDFGAALSWYGAKPAV
ncbi:MAG: C45 family peptidase [Oligoflexia bacterium]|nr:C45 family peptidase [Oligoflexia bacterium]